MRTPLKVVHVVFSLDVGGLERLICDLVCSSAMRGIPMTVCCLDERGTLASAVERAGRRVVVLKRKAGFDPGLIFRLMKFLREEGASVVHTHSLDPMFYAGFAARLARIPIRIHTQHNTWLRTYGWKDRLKFRIATRFFTAIVAVSEEVGRALRPYRIPPARRTIILNGIDETRFTARRPVSGAVRPLQEEWLIGTVARLSPEKGLRRLLEAFSGLHAVHEHSRLLIVGDGPQRRELEDYAERLGIRPSIDFLGYRENVEDVLPTLDLFVLPSLAEGIPLALLEAMACGLPAVATAVGGVPEVIVDGESGVLVPPDDPEALKGTMLELMKRPEKRADLAARAERRVREHFGLTAMAGAYRALYLQEPPERFLKRRIKNGLLKRLPRRLMMWRGRPDRLEVALTFDDGPDAVYTPRILELLKQYEAKATFFVVGEKAEKEKDLVARMLQEGHEIANHSYSHREFDRLSWSEAVEEIDRTQSVIAGVQHRAGRLFRPPYGKLNLASTLGAWMRRLTVVMWSIDLKDFNAEDPDQIARAIAARPIKSGDIILYHGLTPAAISALPALLDVMLRDGRRLVVVSRLLEP